MHEFIGASVGRNGKNNYRDVKKIQIFLNRQFFNNGGFRRNMPLKVNGKCETKTIDAIEFFQTKVIHLPIPNLRVDPISPTFRKLRLNWYGKNDEAYKILKYIIREINTNVKHNVVKKMRKYNAFNVSKCVADWRKEPLLNKVLLSLSRSANCTDQMLHSKTMALLLWTEKVAQDRDWDHKPYILKTFNFKNLKKPQIYHKLGDFNYYHDIWSNIHYGYVGTAAGFTESELLDGAGSEQIVSKLLKFKLPHKTAKGLRGFDDSSDRTSISIGIELYKKDPNNISALDVLEKIRIASKKLNRRHILFY